MDEKLQFSHLEDRKKGNTLICKKVEFYVKIKLPVQFIEVEEELVTISHIH